MGRRGPNRRLDVEWEYWRLVLSGMGTVEACRQLGIGRKTGYRWRAENGGLPPVVLSEPTRSRRYLSLLERQRIAALRRDGLGVREIAAMLGRAPSTVSRELRRNSAAHDRAKDACLAHPEGGLLPSVEITHLDSLAINTVGLPSDRLGRRRPSLVSKAAR
jgi:transposase